MIKRYSTFLLAFTLLLVSSIFAESPFEVDGSGEQLRMTKRCPADSKQYEIFGLFKTIPFSFDSEDSLNITGVSEDEAELFVEDLRRRLDQLRMDARAHALELWFKDYASDKLKETLDNECTDRGGVGVASAGGSSGGGNNSRHFETRLQACCKDDMLGSPSTRSRKFAFGGSAYKKYLRASEPEKLGFKLKGEIDISEIDISER